MKIEIVQLENIRSHVKTTVPFVRGFNCLVGGLGCGKSSILYAIDFALFGDPLGRSFDYLLREGAESGRVILQFTQNGKTYTISRGLKRRGKGIGQDFDELKLLEGEKLIASVKSEAVEEQLKSITGLEKGLFREIVWVRQEHLKELLDIAPRERQKRLDELFGLSDYEIAWNNIASYQREYDAEKRVYEKDPDIVALDKLSKEYNRTAEEFSLLELEIQNVNKKLGEAKRSLEEAERRLKALEELKTSIDELKRKESELKANLVNVEDALASIAEKINTKKLSFEGLRQRLNMVEAQIKVHREKLNEIGISADKSVEELRRHLLTFDEQMASLKAEQEALLRNLQADERRVSSLSLESRCPLCLQTLNSDYKNRLVQTIKRENAERQKTISHLQVEIEELQKLKEKASEAISNIQVLIPRMEELKARMDEEYKALTELTREFEEKQRLENSLRAQLESLRIQISKFNLSELENARKNREQAFKQYYMLDSEFKTMESRKRDLANRIEEIKERIDNAQKKLERVEKLKKALEILGDIRDSYRSIQPKLRSEIVKVLRSFVQQTLDDLAGGEGSPINITIDETYTPYVLSESGVEREVANLSGGERTLVAFAYRLGLGHLIMQTKMGRGLSLLLLDEPTESLGREDGSIDRLAEAIARLKSIEQVISVTHSEAFAEKAEHVIRVEKENGQSRISVEK
ncbi:MAG: SMC family ATPase [Candidatus Bathyarchaeia archaeon]